jgi:hypothetical protein
MRIPGCAETVERGYCEAHQKRQPGADRPNSADRGYDSAWRRFRAWFIWHDPLCADCKYKATMDVHHVEKLSDRPDLRLVGLCHACHAVRTARGE